MVVLLRDSMTVVTYINRQGNVVSVPLHVEVNSLWIEFHSVSAGCQDLSRQKECHGRSSESPMSDDRDKVIPSSSCMWRHLLVVRQVDLISICLNKKTSHLRVSYTQSCPWKEDASHHPWFILNCLLFFHSFWPEITQPCCCHPVCRWLWWLYTHLNNSIQICHLCLWISQEHSLGGGPSHTASHMVVQP